MLALQVAANPGFDRAVADYEKVCSVRAVHYVEKRPALRHPVPRSCAERQQSHRVERGCSVQGS